MKSIAVWVRVGTCLGRRIFGALSGRPPPFSVRLRRGGGMLGRNERHGALGKRCDRERKIHSGVRRDGRAIDHIEPIIAKESMPVIDRALFGTRPHASSAKDMRRGPCAKKRLGSK